MRFWPKNTARPKNGLDEITWACVGGPTLAAEAGSESFGFPRVDWARVKASFEGVCDSADLDLGMTQVARHWLAKTAQALGPSYRVWEDGDFLWLLAGNAKRTSRIEQAVAPAWRRIINLVANERSATLLGGNAMKRAILVFEDIDLYYDYVCAYYPDRDYPFGATSGMYIKTGYPHVVLNAPGGKVSLETLVHELAHGAVDQLPLPRWLNEGFAQLMEDMVRPAHRRRFSLTPHEAASQRRYWGWLGLRQFWSGASFSHKGGQRLSYQLSEVMVRNVVFSCGRKGTFRKFLLHANLRDAGNAAALEYLRTGVGGLAGEFLGPGDWSPKL